MSDTFRLPAGALRWPPVRLLRHLRFLLQMITPANVRRAWVCDVCGMWMDDPLDFDTVECRCDEGRWRVRRNGWGWQKARRWPPSPFRLVGPRP